MVRRLTLRLVTARIPAPAALEEAPVLTGAAGPGIDQVKLEPGAIAACWAWPRRGVGGRRDLAEIDGDVFARRERCLLGLLAVMQRLTEAFRPGVI
jgi:hypothetical protein